MLSCGHGGCSVHLRLLPHLILFVLLLGLGADAGEAIAREAVLLPASCDYRGDRLVVQPSRPTAHEIVTQRERQVFSACRPGRSDRCRPIMVYRFEVACGAARVPWIDLAATLMATSGARAWIEGDRLHVRPPPVSRLGACDGGDSADGFMRPCEPWELAGAGDRERDWVLPSGFAPVHEVGARFVEFSPASEPTPPSSPVASGAGDSGLQIPGDLETAEADASISDVLAGDQASSHEARGAGQRASTVESGYYAFESAEPSADDHQAATSVETAATRSFASRAAEAIASAAPVQSDFAANTTGSTALTGWDPVESRSFWSSIQDSMAGVRAWFPQQLVSALEPLAAMLNSWQLQPGKEGTAALIGLALLSLLVSGFGWYSVRARRARAPAVGGAAGGRQTTIHQFAAPQSSQRSAAGASAPPESSVWAAAGTTLLAPSDERMCGELCRTAHTMLQQIEGRVDELQGVAPLRRVLQREMRSLEQFLTAVMTASPREPEEWRRMRNRLQRIVRELHRLRDIVEGAYRSLSTGGFTSREPPRDKYEAYETLGVNPDVSTRTLKKLVDALRACWHPDLAKDETDRLNREERMKRINIAWDIITSKRQEA